MDVALALEGLISAYSDLLANRDFEGAEDVLTRALGEAPAFGSRIHLQFGRLYREWRKYTSAIDHLNRAAELVGADPFLRMQIGEELNVVRKAQAAERP